MVQYSDQPRTEFSLNSYSTKADVLDAVKALSFRGGEEANTGAALEFVVENLFTQAGGSRIEEAVPQILVLISGGESSDDIREGLLAVKQAGVFLFSIGVLNADSAELQQIATDGNFAYTALDIRNLDALQELILPNIVGVAQRLILLAAPTIVTEGTYAFLDPCISVNRWMTELLHALRAYLKLEVFKFFFPINLSGLVMEKQCFCAETHWPSELSLKKLKISSCNNWHDRGALKTGTEYFKKGYNKKISYNPYWDI